MSEFVTGNLGTLTVYTQYYLLTYLFTPHICYILNQHDPRSSPVQYGTKAHLDGGT